jgi:hypothetical protein
MKGEEILQVAKATAASLAAKYVETLRGRTVLAGGGQIREAFAYIKTGSRVISVLSERYDGSSGQDLSVHTDTSYGSIVLKYEDWGFHWRHGKLKSTDVDVLAKALIDKSLNRM